MGALCGKESKDDNFAGAGRPLGSAPPPAGVATSAPLPANKRVVVGGPPRTLGGGGGPSSAAGGDPAADARRKAAEAAEVCSMRAAEEHASQYDFLSLLAWPGRFPIMIHITLTPHGFFSSSGPL